MVIGDNFRIVVSRREKRYFVERECGLYSS